MFKKALFLVLILAICPLTFAGTDGDKVLSPSDQFLGDIKANLAGNRGSGIAPRNYEDQLAKQYYDRKVPRKKRPIQTEDLTQYQLIPVCQLIPADEETSGPRIPPVNVQGVPDVVFVQILKIAGAEQTSGFRCASTKTLRLWRRAFQGLYATLSRLITEGNPEALSQFLAAHRELNLNRSLTTFLLEPEYVASAKIEIARELVASSFLDALKLLLRQNGNTCLEFLERVLDEPCLKRLAAIYGSEWDGLDPSQKQVFKGILVGMDSVQRRVDTPLELAVEMKDGQAVIALLNSGADANMTNVQGVPMLSVAAAGGRLAVVEALLNGGAEINFLDPQGMRPVDHAMDDGRFEIVGYLVSNGSEPSTHRGPVFHRVCNIQ